MAKTNKTKEVIEYDVEYRYGTKWNQSPEKKYKYMECRSCGQYSTVGNDAVAVTCYECVQELVGPPEIKKRRTATKPAGWHWMAVFVDKDGTVYNKGKERPELKGTLDPTEIVPKKRLSKKEKEKYKHLAAVKVSKLKKSMSKMRWKKDKRLAMREIKYFSRIMNGKFPTDFKEKLFAE